jgi:hypothetical protein
VKILGGGNIPGPALLKQSALKVQEKLKILAEDSYCKVFFQFGSGFYKKAEKITRSTRVTKKERKMSEITRLKKKI